MSFAIHNSRKRIRTRTHKFRRQLGSRKSSFFLNKNKQEALKRIHNSYVPHYPPRMRIL